MTQTFYPVTAQHPPVSVRVVVHWFGRELSAMRTVDRKTREVSWVTFERGKLQVLPPEGQERDWGADPEWWRPEHPDKWLAALPAPLELQAAPRMAYRTPRGKYAAMSAQAAQSDATRAELEAHADEVMGEAADPSAGSSSQWWLAEALTYSDAGEISQREAEGRVARAILVDGIKNRYGGPRAFAETSSALQGFIHETMQSEDADNAPMFEPTRRDLSDYETAFAWFVALNPPELWHAKREAWALSQAQFVLVARALVPPRSWRQIARFTNTSHEGARQVYGAAIAGVHRAANGKRVLPYMTVQDRMAALRARNRRAKMEAS